jgi:fatty acid desaturase
MSDPNENKPLPLNYSVPAPFTIPRYRKIFSGILVSAGLVLAIIALFATSDYERRGIWTVSFALIVWGVVIRFQHVGL